MSAATLVTGVRVKRNGADVADITTVTIPSIFRDVKLATKHFNDFETRELGYVKYGPLIFQTLSRIEIGNFATAMAINTLDAYVVTLVDGTIISFNGRVMDAQFPPASLDAVMGLQVTIQPTGLLTFANLTFGLVTAQEDTLITEGGDTLTTEGGESLGY